jgi:hypothetical protein
MRWTIEFSSPASRQFRKLEQREQQAIGAVLRRSVGAERHRTRRCTATLGMKWGFSFMARVRAGSIVHGPAGDLSAFATAKDSIICALARLRSR